MTTEMTPAPWLTAAQVANELGVTAQTVYRLAQNGTIPARLIGNRYKFSPADLESFLEHARIAAPGSSATAP